MSSDVLLTYFSIQQSLCHTSSPYSILFFLGCTFMSSGVLLTYFSIQQSLGLTTLTYGLMFGFGTALAYAPPMGVAMRWFPRQKGLVNGIIVGGFGLGAFIFNQASPVGQHKDTVSFRSMRM
jgi:MFS family permease